MSMKRKIIIGIASIFLIVIIYCFFNLGNFLVVSDDLKKADAIVVFSGDNGFRTEVGVELLKKGYGDYLILSGGKVYDDVTMAELMKDHAIKLGAAEDKFTTKSWTNGNSILIIISEYLKLVGYFAKGYI